tara:strand:+ start:282 stop:1169 length:888 start_codon:yes stop_codon:yes gene_type:complete
MKKYKILIPVYNDWKSVIKLLENVDLQIINWEAEVSVLIINDASTEKQSENLFKFKKIKSIQVINMKINQGHARCNAAGLKYLVENEDFDYVILMDGDGEDRPEELTSLFNKSKENPSNTITANRVKRSESFFFKLMYACHKILTYVFTGKLIKFGNYSCLPKTDAAKLVKDPCIWSSFSGSVAKIIINRMSVPSIRGQRYFGPSQMNLFKLLIHSFSIIAVFKKSVIIRSAIFLIIYLSLIFKNLSFVKLFPVIVLLVFLFIIFRVSSRENLVELNNSLKNIDNVSTLGNLNDR